MHFEKRNRFYILRRKPSAMVKALTSTALIGVLTLSPLPGLTDTVRWVGNTDNADDASNWIGEYTGLNIRPEDFDSVLVTIGTAKLLIGSTANYLSLTLSGTGQYIVELGSSLQSTITISIKENSRFEIHGYVTGDVDHTNRGSATPSLTISGTLDGRLSSSGYVLLRGIGTITGNTSLSGLVRIASNYAAVSTGKQLLVTGGHIYAEKSNTLAPSELVIRNSPATFSAAAGQTLTLSPGTFSSRTGTLIFGGDATATGTVVLNPGDVTSVGHNVIVNYGTLRIGAGAVTEGLLGATATSSTTVAAGATLDLNGATLQINNLSGGGRIHNSSSSARSDLTLYTNEGHSDTFSGSFLDAGEGSKGIRSITKTGAGTLTLTGQHDAIDTVTVSAGTLVLAGRVVESKYTTGDYGDTFKNDTTVHIEGGATLRLERGEILGNLVGDENSILDLGVYTLELAADGDSTFAGEITGTGTLTKDGLGTLTLSGDSGDFTGKFEVAGGALLVTGDLGSVTSGGADVTIYSGATLGGNGYISGDVTIMGGGTLSAGTSPGTLHIGGDLLLSGGTITVFQLGTPSVVGSGGHDLVTVDGDLTLAGLLSIKGTNSESLQSGYYRLFSYSGELRGNSLSMSSSEDLAYEILTNMAGQVNLRIGDGPEDQYWDGAGAAGDGAVQGGSGTWIAGSRNWTTEDGEFNDRWLGKSAVFAGTAGTVTVTGDQAVDHIHFQTSGYRLNSDLGRLTLGEGTHGITVEGAGSEATIETTLTGAGGIEKLGAGTLILSGVNSYVGTTIVSAGTLALTSGNAIHKESGVEVASGAVFELLPTVSQDYQTPIYVTIGSLSGAEGSRVDLGISLLIVGQGDGKEFAGNLTGSGIFALSGSTYFSFSGENDFTGDLMTSAVFDPPENSSLTLELKAGATIAAQSVAAAVNSTVILNGGNLTDDSAVLNVLGILEVNGSETAGAINLYQSGKVEIKETGAVLTLNGTASQLDSTGNSSIAGLLTGLGSLNLTGGTTYVTATGLVDVFTTVGEDGTVVNNGTMRSVTTSGTFTNAGVIEGAIRVEGGVLNLNTGSDIHDKTGTIWLSAGEVNVNTDEVLGTFIVTGGTANVNAVLATEELISGETARIVTAAGSGIILGEDSDDETITAGNLDGEISGSGYLRKIGGGNLYITGSHSYSGDTFIEGGQVIIGENGTLGTGAVENEGELRFRRSGAVTFANDISGSGKVSVDASGITTLSGTNSFTGGVTVERGILGLSGGAALADSGAVEVRAEGALQLKDSERVGALTNAGLIDLSTGDAAAGTLLSINGDYSGGGSLWLDVILGGDGSASDALLVEGDSSGVTQVYLTNLGGTGALTSSGIRIVEVEGNSAGTFSLANGDTALKGGGIGLSAGIFVYALRQQAGDWVMQSQLQEYVTTIEALPSALLSLMQPSSLAGRLSGRQKPNSSDEGDGITISTSGTMASGPAAETWVQLSGGQMDVTPRASATNLSYDHSGWKLQAGIDSALSPGASGAWVIGASLFTGGGDLKASSATGDGVISTDAMGFGLTATWYGHSGFYSDIQLEFSRFDNDIRSSASGLLASGVDGSGKLASIEMGRVIALESGLTLTPQAQLSWAKVDFDSFTAGGGGPLVSLKDSESLKLRIGLAAERSWRKADGSAGRLYGIANLTHDFKGESSVIIDGLALTTSDPKTVAELGLGASIDWQSGKRTTSLYGQINASHGLDRGDLSGLSGTAGLRITW